MIQVLSWVISTRVETNTGPGQSHDLGPNLLNLWAWVLENESLIGQWVFSFSSLKKTKNPTLRKKNYKRNIALETFQDI